MRPRAAVLIIGDEILSGRTPDQNLPPIARTLAERGILLEEVRITGDHMPTLVAHMGALRARYTCILTTGGLGPTHDDITVDAVCQATNRARVWNEEAWAMTQAFHGRDLDPVYKAEAFLPEGCTLIPNPVTGAPGCSVDGFHLMAGVPRIMRGMLDSLAPSLPQGQTWYTHTLSFRGRMSESLIAGDLARIQAAHPGVVIGSYPIDQTGGDAPAFALQLTFRAENASELQDAVRACEALLASQRTGAIN
jgi:molybdopterin-biosynthesis enzyme MoeA-like protein